MSSNTLAVIRFHDIFFEMYTRTDISTVLPHDVILRRAREPQKPRRTQKNGDIGACDTTRFFSPHARPIFRPSERILSLPLPLLFPPPPPPPGTLPPRVSLWHGYRQMGPPFCARIVTPSTRPPSDARAREQERKRKREREHGAVCYNARPLLALLPVLLLLSLLLPVAAEWRMGKQRADEPAATSSAALEANYTPPARLASS